MCPLASWRGISSETLGAKSMVIVCKKPADLFVVSSIAQPTYSFQE